MWWWELVFLEYEKFESEFPVLREYIFDYFWRLNSDYLRTRLQHTRWVRLFDSREDFWIKLSRQWKVIGDKKRFTSCKRIRFKQIYFKLFAKNAKFRLWLWLKLINFFFYQDLTYYKRCVCILHTKYVIQIAQQKFQIFQYRQRLRSNSSWQQIF